MRFKNPQKEQQARAERRRARVRAVVNGTAARPRLVVSRSLMHVRAQIIDDTTSKTLVDASDLLVKKDADVGERKGKVAEAYAVGKIIAERAKEKGISTVVFDRAGKQYHGRVAAVADGARDGGLKF